jgi:hypothetical protein
MLNLSSRAQLVLGLVLALLMAASRGHHFASLDNLPSASWALFFIAGFYLRSKWVFAGLMAEAVLLDMVAVGFQGAIDLCITVSYPMLLPAYGALWLGGQWLATGYRPHWSMLLPLILSVLVASTLCQLISSGSYYYFSGNFAEPTLAEFSQRMLRYTPLSLQSMAFYIAITTLLHAAWLSAIKLRDNRQMEVL